MAAIAATATIIICAIALWFLEKVIPG